jgi:hypothetical protein
MTMASQVPMADGAVRKVRRVQEITIVWMSSEAPVSLLAAWMYVGRPCWHLAAHLELRGSCYCCWRPMWWPRRFCVSRDSESREQQVGNEVQYLLSTQSPTTAPARRLR